MISLNKNLTPNFNSSYVISDSLKEINLNIISKIEAPKFNYKGKEFTKKIKINSPICDKCFRLIYISFNYIKNYISSYCQYCKQLYVYKYDQFLSIIQQNINPLLNSSCRKCNNSFIFSDIPFFLIEQTNNNYFILCNNCSNNNKDEYVKKINLEDLMIHYLYLYENGQNEYKLDKLKEIESKSQKYNKLIEENLKFYEEYKNNILFIESIIKNVPLSLKKKAEEKIINLKNEIKIKNKIIEYYNEYKNFITINNMCSLLHSILDFSNLNLKNNNYKLDDSYKLIENFIIVINL